jgi:hypothetical protein
MLNNNTRSTTPRWSSTGRPSWCSPTRRCTASWTASSPGAPQQTTPSTGRASTTSSVSDHQIAMEWGKRSQSQKQTSTNYRSWEAYSRGRCGAAEVPEGWAWCGDRGPCAPEGARRPLHPCGRCRRRGGGERGGGCRGRGSGRNGGDDRQSCGACSRRRRRRRRRLRAPRRRSGARRGRTPSRRRRSPGWCCCCRWGLGLGVNEDLTSLSTLRSFAGASTNNISIISTSSLFGKSKEVIK